MVMTTFLGAGYSTWRADTANSVVGQFKGHNSGVLGGIWQVIKLSQDIMPNNIFTKFNKDLMNTLWLRERKPCGCRPPATCVPIIRPSFQMVDEKDLRCVTNQSVICRFVAWISQISVKIDLWCAWLTWASVYIFSCTWARPAGECSAACPHSAATWRTFGRTPCGGTGCLPLPVFDTLLSADWRTENRQHRYNGFIKCDCHTVDWHTENRQHCYNGFIKCDCHTVDWHTENRQASL